MNITEQVAALQATADKTFTDADTRIAEAVEENGNYTHNVISCTLRGVASKLGYDKANELVRKHDLTKLYGMQEVIVNG